MSNNIIVKTLTIEGMTCVNCENRIENKLRKTQGIIDVKVSFSTGKATITYDSNEISMEEIEEIIEQLDYKVVKTILTQEKSKNGTQVLAFIIIIFSLYTILNRLGGFNIINVFPVAKEGMSYAMLFVIGLFTSIHCIAMCGGINLSQCVPHNVTPVNNQNKLSTLRPTFLYNLGRVISYTIVGGIVGALGSVISFSGAAKGIVQLIAGIFMVIMGLNMLNIFPWLKRFNPHMPKIFAKKINEQKNSNSPLYIGLLNGLMPCGPLQAMQIYALSTGNPVEGALSMLLFSLGTVPLMFGLGALSSILSKKFTHKMMSASAVLVVILGVFMFNNGLSLSGFAVPSMIGNAKNGSSNSNVAELVDGVQTVTTTLSSGRYEPITVQKGIPVRWTLQADESNLNGCNNSIIIPKYNQEYKLKPGDNIIEFTPKESGTIPFSCWMGMIRSKITVVDDITKIEESSAVETSSYKIPTDNVAVAKIKDGIQTVKIEMNDTRFLPAIIVMQSGIETNFIINATKINDRNNTLIFPLYNAQINMKEGENPVSLIPEVDFDLSASDNSFSAFVKVVDDINNIDVESIKDDVKDYVPSGQEAFDNIGGGGASCH